MRNCNNCFNGHYNLSERGEEIYCDEGGVEEWVEPNFTCEDHRYVPGMEEEKNILLYDEDYLGPGFLIINTKGNIAQKFIKFYVSSISGYPDYSIRAYSPELRDSSDSFFSILEFDFRDIEDNELFDVMSKLSYDLSRGAVINIDRNRHGENHLYMKSNGIITKMIFKKDVYKGSHLVPNAIDIHIGDVYTCPDYMAFVELYNNLLKLNPKKTEETDIKKLLIKK